VRIPVHRPPAASPLDIGSASERGARPDNQDRIAVGAHWAAVSDGMGGYAGGALAAELTVAAAGPGLDAAAGAAEGDAVAAVRDAFGRANDEVRAGRRRQPEFAQMGATLVVALALGAGRWIVANVGDSPAWLVRSEETLALAEEHNVAAELVRDGAISPEAGAHHPGRHMLVRAIGLEPTVTAALGIVTVAPGERLVLASDGLAGGLDPMGLHRRLGSSRRGSAARDATRLVDAALAGGTTDNVSVVVIRGGGATEAGPGGAARP
jgi:serine/threonine protein phosphatase PrpC